MLPFLNAGPLWKVLNCLLWGLVTCLEPGPKCNSILWCRLLQFRFCKSYFIHGCTDLLKMVYVEILLIFGNYFRLSYITIIIFKISFKNCVSSSLNTYYSAFLYICPFDLSKTQSRPAQKFIWTPPICTGIIQYTYK